MLGLTRRLVVKSKDGPSPSYCGSGLSERQSNQLPVGMLYDSVKEAELAVRSLRR